MFFPPPPPVGPLDVSQRLTLVVDALCRALAAHASKYWVVAPFILVLWPYLRRLVQRFEALAARVRAGLPARPARPQPSEPQPAEPRTARTSRSPKLGFPGWNAWLIWLVPETGGLGPLFRQLLADPELAALLEAAPQAGRILRPLCRMMGVVPGDDVPPALFPPPVPPAVTSPATAAAAAPRRPRPAYPSEAAQPIEDGPALPTCCPATA